jgi:hypothetical protein
MNSICSSTKTKETPSTKSVRPSDGRALGVYTDIPHVEEFLTRPEFVLSKQHPFLFYDLYLFFFEGLAVF